MSQENKKRVELINLIGKAYYEIHHKIKDGDIDELWLKGGRGSLKSSFVAIEIILGVMRDPDANAIVFLQVGASIRRGRCIRHHRPRPRKAPRH